MSLRWSFLLGGVLLLAGAGCSAPSGTGQPPPEQPPELKPAGSDLFEDVTAASGIAFSYRNGEDADPPVRSILESLGGGVALLDYDRDGLLDVYIVGGGYYDGPGNKLIKGWPGRLYRNLGQFQFADVTREAGLEALAGGQPWFYSHGTAVADYDRDGWPDLLVTGWGRIALFRNVPGVAGRRMFVDVSRQAGLDEGITWATSAAFADLDGDGFPDLYVCQYVDWSFAKHPECMYDGKHPDLCTPKLFNGLPHKVYRNTGEGTFVDVSGQAGLRPGGAKASKGLGVLAFDADEDGRPDLYVANDTTDNFLYLNRSSRGTIRLEETGALAGVARDGGGGANGSMGVDAGDPNRTGRPALWVTNYENELHALYRPMGQRDRVTYTYHSLAAGLAALGTRYVGWGTGFVDLQRRGWEDLIVVNGHVIRHHPEGLPRAQRPVLLWNRGGWFVDVTEQGGTYFRQPHTGRGLALGDLDNDGAVDAVVSHVNEPVAVLRNVAGSGNHWVGVELLGREHADVVGARVILQAGGQTQTRFAKGGGSYLSASDRRLVFGLGPTDRIDRLTVVWPDGRRQEWTGLAVDRYHALSQGKFGN